MSKNIVLQKTGVSATLNNISSLVTAEAGGGNCTWVWDDETQLAELTVTANGTYNPGTGVYGFSNVHVAVEPPFAETNENGTFTVDFDEAGHARLTWERNS